MKKLTIWALSALALVTLSACGGDDGGATTEDLTTKMFETSEFSMSVPRDWEVIQSADFPSTVPPQTLIAFRNNVKDPFYTGNIAVLKQPLAEPLSNLDFAKFMIQKHKDTAHDFTELGRQDHGDGGSNTVIFSFQGRDAFDSDLIVLRETYLVVGNSAFIVTAAHSPQEDEGVIIQLEDVLKSFTLK